MAQNSCRNNLRGRAPEGALGHFWALPQTQQPGRSGNSESPDWLSLSAGPRPWRAGEEISGSLGDAQHDVETDACERAVFGGTFPVVRDCLSTTCYCPQVLRLVAKTDTCSAAQHVRYKELQLQSDVSPCRQSLFPWFGTHTFQELHTRLALDRLNSHACCWYWGLPA